MLGMVREVGEKRKADAALRRAVEEIETLVERCSALEIKSQTAAGQN